jgi:hypothetical protein
MLRKLVAGMQGGWILLQWQDMISAVFYLQILLQVINIKYSSSSWIQLLCEYFSGWSMSVEIHIQIVYFFMQRYDSFCAFWDDINFVRIIVKTTMGTITSSGLIQPALNCFMLTVRPAEGSSGSGTLKHI